MAELYLTLVSGRTVHVCSDWDGAAPTRIGTVDATGAPDDGEGIEAGEYYRDIHRSTSNVRTDTTEITSGNWTAGEIVPVAAALYPTSVKTGLGVVNTSGTLMSPLGWSALAEAFEVGVSDEIKKAKPRTWQKVCTWLVFTGTAGTYQWRAASVDGWSSKAPID